MVDSTYLPLLFLWMYNEKGGKEMRAPFLVRRVDELGRIVIPVELRRMLELDSGQDVALTIQSDALVLRKFTPGCVFCGGLEQLVVFEGKSVCAACRRRLLPREKE